MKTLAVCSPGVKRSFPDGEYGNFKLYDQEMIIGLADFPVLSRETELTDHQVLIKVNAFSCNYRDRTLLVHFNGRCREESHSLKSLFSPFGSDFVGEVVQTGSEVQSLSIGDRVIPDDAYPFKKNGQPGGVPTNCASQRFLIVEEEQLASIPAGMPDEVAAGFSVAAQTVYSMIRKASVLPGQKVLVTAGSSHTSLALISALSHLAVDLSVITTSMIYEQKLYAMGVKEVIPHSLLQQKKGASFLTKGKFDIVFDPFIDLYFANLVPVLADGCKYIYCGFYNQFPASHMEDNLLFKTVYLHSILQNLSLIGNCLGNHRDLQNAIDDFIKGRFGIPVDTVCQSQDIVTFMEKSMGGKPRFGKVIYCYPDESDF